MRQALMESPKMTLSAAATETADLFHPALELHAIVESAHNPRKRYDQTALEEMATSMRQHGVITPVLVRHTADAGRFELAAGHRRSRAARLAGLSTVPAIIRHLDDRAFLEILHLENLQREDVDPLDEALGFEQLLTQGYDTGSLAHKLGRSLTYVASRLRLLALGPAARAAMQLGYLPLSHAIELAKLSEAQQDALLDELFQLQVDRLRAYSAGEISEHPPTDAAEAVEGDDDSNRDDDEDPDDDQSARGPFREWDARVEGPERRDDPFAQWPGAHLPTLEDLKAEIRAGMRRLSVIPWDLADAELLPAAGACSGCAKRSGHAPLLFAELDTGEDVCLDAACFSEKARAFEARRREAEGPSPKAKKAPAAVEADRDDWQERSRKAQQAAERAREKAQRGRTAAVRAVCEGVTEFHFLDSAFIRTFFVALLYELTMDTLDRVLKHLQLSSEAPAGSHGYGWKRERIAAWARDEQTDDAALYPALLFAVLGYETTVPLYSTQSQKPERLEAFGALLKVDVRAIDAKARAEKPAKPEKPAKGKSAKKAVAA